MKTYIETTNLASLILYFVPQTLKPGYGLVWVAAKQETVIKGVNAINSQEAKHFKLKFWLTLAEEFEKLYLKTSWLLWLVWLESVN